MILMFGLQSIRSCERHRQTEGLTKREATGVVLFDVEQVFDVVWRSAL